MAGSGGLRSAVLGVVRGVLLLTGLAVFAIGTLAVFVPSAAGFLPVDAMIAALGSDYVVLAAVGLAAVAIAALVLLAIAVSGVDEADVPIVESVESAPHPGQAVDRSVDDDSGGRVPDSRVTRLTEAAVRTLMRTEHCSRSTAERRVAEGTWTDDEVAADFLADGDDGLFRTAVSDRERVRRTAEEIERLEADGSPEQGGEAPNGGGGESPGPTDGPAGERRGTSGDTTVRQRTPSPDLQREGAPRRSGTGTGGK